MKREAILTEDQVDQSKTMIVYNIHVDYILCMIEEMPEDAAETLLRVYYEAVEDYGHRFNRTFFEIARFVEGWNKILPEAWKKILTDLQMEKDPEWSTYHRLREKFKSYSGGTG